MNANHSTHKQSPSAILEAHAPKRTDFVEPILFARRQNESEERVGNPIPKKDFSGPTANVVGMRSFFIITCNVRYAGKPVTLQSERCYKDGTTWYDGVIYTIEEIEKQYPNRFTQIINDTPRKDSKGQLNRFIFCRDGMWRHFGPNDSVEKVPKK